MLKYKKHGKRAAKRFVGFKTPTFGGDVFCRGAFLKDLANASAGPVEMKISSWIFARPEDRELGPEEL